MNKRDNKLMTTFTNINQDQKLIESAIKIQNDINIYANSKIIAIAVAKTDISLDIVASTLAEVYALQNQKTLLIDCDMYAPFLNNLFNKDLVECGLDDLIGDKINMDKLINHISDKLDAVFTEKTNYPTEVFKSKNYYDFICEIKDRYEHVILVMPSIVDHQDILMSKELITATLLVARKSKVSKKDLFDSIQTLKVNDIPYVGTIYLK